MASCSSLQTGHQLSAIQIATSKWKLASGQPTQAVFMHNTDFLLWTGVPAPEDHDPVMDRIAAALREIIDSMPPRQVRRVGWGWWYALQGMEPDPEDEHYLDWKLDVLFDECMREVFSKAE